MGQADGKAIAVVLRGHLSMSGDMFDCHDWVWDATGIQRVDPAMLLNMLQRTGQCLAIRNDPTQTV